MSRVVGSETAGRMILDKLAGITVSLNNVPATVNPVATEKDVSRDTGGEVVDARMITTQHVDIVG